jgi:hypothetical protein
MSQFIAFALYLMMSATLLVVVPVMMHPTLSMPRKMLIVFITFFILMPGGLALYTFLGAPNMAVSN